MGIHIHLFKYGVVFHDIKCRNTDKQYRKYHFWPISKRIKSCNSIAEAKKANIST